MSPEILSGPTVFEPSAHPDDDIFNQLFEWGVGEGAVQLTWQQATRCTCYSVDSLQPTWGCPNCSGNGVIYGAPQTITGLFRSQSRWLSFRQEGELAHGEAQLTTPLSVRPGYIDRRVRDRFFVPAVPTDGSVALPVVLPSGFEGRVFSPAAEAVPFIFNDIQRAWRVQLQSSDLAQRLNP